MTTQTVDDDDDRNQSEEDRKERIEAYFKKQSKTLVLPVTPITEESINSNVSTASSHKAFQKQLSKVEFIAANLKLPPSKKKITKEKPPG